MYTNSLYGSVDPDSLASALAHAQGDLGDGLTPKELISSWADQAGYPVVDVSEDYYDPDSLVVTQARSLFSEFKPVAY